MAAEPLPEIPDGSRPRSAAARFPEADAGHPDGTTSAGSAGPATSRGARAAAPRLSDRPSSRLGGAILLGVGGARRRGGGRGPARRAGWRVDQEAANDRGADGIHARPTTTARRHDGTSTHDEPRPRSSRRVNLNPPSGTGCGQGRRRSWSRRAAPTGSSSRPQNVAAQQPQRVCGVAVQLLRRHLRLGFVKPAGGQDGQAPGRQRAADATPVTTSNCCSRWRLQSNPKSPGHGRARRPVQGRSGYGLSAPPRRPAADEDRISRGSGSAPPAPGRGACRWPERIARAPSRLDSRAASAADRA